MEIVYERVAAIDVGKKVIAVAVRVPGERAGKRGSLGHSAGHLPRAEVG